MSGIKINNNASLNNWRRRTITWLLLAGIGERNENSSNFLKVNSYNLFSTKYIHLDLSLLVSDNEENKNKPH